MYPDRFTEDGVSFQTCPIVITKLFWWPMFVESTQFTLHNVNPVLTVKITITKKSFCFAFGVRSEENPRISCCEILAVKTYHACWSCHHQRKVSQSVVVAEESNKCGFRNFDAASISILRKTLGHCLNIVGVGGWTLGYPACCVGWLGWR